MATNFPDLIAQFEDIVAALKVKLSNDATLATSYNGENIQSIAKDIKDKHAALFSEIESKWSAIQALVDSSLVFETKAALDAYTPTADANGFYPLAKVWHDTTANNGTYGWDATNATWVKSEYDLDTYTDNKLTLLTPAVEHHIPLSVIDLNFETGNYYWGGTYHSIAEFQYSQFPTIDDDGYHPVEGDFLTLPDVSFFNDNKQAGTLIVEYDAPVSPEATECLYSITSGTGGTALRIEQYDGSAYMQASSDGSSSSNFGLTGLPRINSERSISVISFSESEPVLCSHDGDANTSASSWFAPFNDAISLGVGYRNFDNRLPAVSVIIKRVLFIPYKLDQSAAILASTGSGLFEHSISGKLKQLTALIESNTAQTNELGNSVSDIATSVVTTQTNLLDHLSTMYPAATLDIDFTKSRYFWDGQFHSVNDLLYDQTPNIDDDGYHPVDGDRLRIPYLDWFNQSKGASGVIVIQYDDEGLNATDGIFSMLGSSGSSRFRLELYTEDSYLSSSSDGSASVSGNIDRSNSYVGAKTRVMAWTEGEKTIDALGGGSQLFASNWLDHFEDISTISIGYVAQDDGRYAINAAIKRILFFPIAIDSELAAHTSAGNGLIATEHNRPTVKDISQMPQGATMYIDFLTDTYIWDDTRHEFSDFAFRAPGVITSRGFQAFEGEGIIMPSLDWFDKTQGTFFVEIDTDDILDATQRNSLGLSGGSGATKHRMEFMINGVYNQAYGVGSNINAITQNEYLRVSRLAFSWKEGEVPHQCANGNVVFGVNAVPINDQDYTKMTIGYRPDDILELNGYIRKIWYVPDFTPHNELISITSKTSRTNIMLGGDSFCSELWFKYVCEGLDEGEYRRIFSDGVGGSTLAAQEKRFINRLQDLKHTTFVHTDDASSLTTDPDDIQAMLDRLQRILQMTSGRFLVMEKGLDVGFGLVDGVVSNPVRDALIAALQDAYPDRFVAVDALMRAASDGSDLDEQYLAWGLWPASVYNTAPDDPFTESLDFHLNDKGCQIYAAAAVAKLNEFGW